MNAWEYFKGRLLHDLFWIAVTFVVVVVYIALAILWDAIKPRRKPTNTGRRDT